MRCQVVKQWLRQSVEALSCKLWSIRRDICMELDRQLVEG